MYKNNNKNNNNNGVIISIIISIIFYFLFGKTKKKTTIEWGEGEFDFPKAKSASDNNNCCCEPIDQPQNSIAAEINIEDFERENDALIGFNSDKNFDLSGFVLTKYEY